MSEAVPSKGSERPGKRKQHFGTDFFTALTDT